ncbi:MAG: hypothetical protein U0892_13105 [Pirellulales bacterium]
MRDEVTDRGLSILHRIRLPAPWTIVSATNSTVVGADQAQRVFGAQPRIYRRAFQIPFQRSGDERVLLELRTKLRTGPDLMINGLRCDSLPGDDSAADRLFDITDSLQPHNHIELIFREDELSALNLEESQPSARSRTLPEAEATILIATLSDGLAG